MTDTETTTQAAPETAIGEIEEVETGAVSLVANDAKTTETAIDTIKADVTGDASGVGKALAADAGDVKSDIAIAKAHAEAAVTHIEVSGFVSDELTKAKRLLAVVVAYIEKHV